MQLPMCKIKKHSSHDPNIQTGIIKGFVNRAFTNCSETHIKEELQFLIDMFVENGYPMSNVKSVIAQVRERRTKNTRTAGERTTSEETNNQSTTITLPWIPGVLPKLRKVYKKAGYKTVYKKLVATEKISFAPKTKQSYRVIVTLEYTK